MSAVPAVDALQNTKIGRSFLPLVSLQVVSSEEIIIGNTVPWPVCVFSLWVVRVFQEEAAVVLGFDKGVKATGVWKGVSRPRPIAEPKKV